MDPGPVPDAPILERPSIPTHACAETLPPTTPSDSQWTPVGLVAEDAESMTFPYFVDEKLLRSDIRSDPSDGSERPGVLLTIGQLARSGWA